MAGDQVEMAVVVKERAVVVHSYGCDNDIRRGYRKSPAS